MGFGDFLSEAVSAGASALGVDTDDIGGLFEQAKGALGGDTDDLFGAAAERLGIDSDDVTSAVRSFAGGGDSEDPVDQISQLFGGGGDAGSGAGGGFGGIVSGFLGDGGGDIGGVAQQALGGFGSLLAGAGAGAGAAGGAGGVAAFLPDSVREAFAEAADLPIVQDAAGGDWATLASSVPGLDGALGSFGLSTKGVADHIEAVGAQAVDGGSSWSIGSMLADHGTDFLSTVAAPVSADGVWSSLPGIAQSAGVELPGWASDIGPGGLSSQGGRMLPDGGFMTAEATGDPWGMSQHAQAQAATQVRQPNEPAVATSAASGTDDMTDDMTGESQVAAQADDSLDAFDAQPVSLDDSGGLNHEGQQESEYAGDDVDPAAVQPVDSPESPTFDEPATAPDQFAAADELEDSLGDLGDGIE